MSGATKGLVMTSRGALANLADANPLILRGMCEIEKLKSASHTGEMTPEKPFERATLPQKLRTMYERLRKVWPKKGRKYLIDKIEDLSETTPLSLKQYQSLHSDPISKEGIDPKMLVAFTKLAAARILKTSAICGYIGETITFNEFSNAIINECAFDNVDAIKPYLNDSWENAKLLVKLMYERMENGADLDEACKSSLAKVFVNTSNIQSVDDPDEEQKLTSPY